MSSYPTCTVDDCDRPHHSRGLCQMHRHRLARSGTLEKMAPIDRGCLVEGCTEKHSGRGFCKKHYQQANRPDPAPTTGRRRKPVEVPMPANNFQAAGCALVDAQQIICDVRDVAPEDVWRTISKWSPTRMVSAVITLAAMVPDDQTVADLLAWTDGAGADRVAPLLRSVS